MIRVVVLAGFIGGIAWPASPSIAGTTVYYCETTHICDAAAKCQTGPKMDFDVTVSSTPLDGTLNFLDSEVTLPRIEPTFFGDPQYGNGETCIGFMFGELETISVRLTMPIDGTPMKYLGNCYRFVNQS